MLASMAGTFLSRILQVSCIVAVALAQSPAGKFTGTWSGASGAGGSFRISLEQTGGNWKCEVVFGFENTEVKTNVTMVKVEGARVEAQYDFDIGGNRLQSAIEGAISGDKLAGTYKTKALQDSAPVDQGKFEATRGK